MRNDTRPIDDIRRWRFVVSEVMRYETPSDYLKNGTVVVYKGISRKDRIGLAIHELIEMILIRYYGLTVDEIDSYDMKKGGCYYAGMYDENPKYKHAHQIATRVEKLLMKELGENWKQYDKRVMDAKVHWKSKSKFP